MEQRNSGGEKPAKEESSKEETQEVTKNLSPQPDQTSPEIREPSRKQPSGAPSRKCRKKRLSEKLPDWKTFMAFVKDWKDILGLISVVSALIAVIVSNNPWQPSGGKVQIPSQPQKDPIEIELEPSKRPPSPRPPPGRLLIDAVPWGSITAILDTNDKPLELGEDVYTPLVLDLPMGRYTITIENPPNFQKITKSVKISPGATEHLLVRFQDVDVEAYLKDQEFE